MTCKMMHQIGYGFYWSIKKWSKLGPKSFWLILRVFFVYALLHLMSYKPHDFSKWKSCGNICGKFHQYRIFGYEVKNFQGFLYWFKMQWNGPFLVLLGPCSLRYCSILLKFWPEVVSNKTNRVFEKPFKILNFSLMEGTQSLHFCSILGPNVPLENQKYC